MSYKTYTTEAIVCGSRANNTSDKSFLLFTKDAGMLWASARSVREERSRQRFALQDFSLIKVSLVRGKSGWRVGSAESVRNYFAESQSQAGRGFVAAVVKLLRQFVQGEVAHPHIFDDTKAVLVAALEKETEAAKLLDLFTLRALYRLGYIAPEARHAPVLEDGPWWQCPALDQKAKETLAKAKAVSHL